MKKFVAIALGTLVAMTAAPALALNTQNVDAYILVTAWEVDSVGAATFDAADGTELDSFNFSSIPVTFGSPSKFAEFSPVTGTGYFSNFSDELYALNVDTEDGLDWITDSATVNEFLPTSDGLFAGLAIDDATDTLYLLVNDPDAGHYFLVEIDQAAGAVGTPLEMPTSLTDAGARDLAISDGIIYVLTDVDQISKFNLSDGSPAGSIAYIDSQWFDPVSIDISAGGILRIVNYNENNDENDFYSYNLNTEEWSAATSTNENYDAMAWYGAGDFTPELAETGFDASGLALTAVALAGAGAVALRRRARR